MKRKIIFFQHYLFLCILIITTSCKDGNTLKIVNNGVSDYEIMISTTNSKEELFAAEELQKYVSKISSVKIPIVNNLTKTEAKKKIFIKKEKLNKNQIIIKTEGENIAIIGDSDSTLKNAVYEFLEVYLNCKWYTPKVEKIPISKTIILDKNLYYDYTPKITTRTVHSRLFYKNPSFANKLKVTTEAFPYYVPKGRVHTFHRFIPEEKYYKSHPEYFSLNNGKRLPTQLCLSNEKVYEIVRDSVASLFDKYPEASVISVSQNDNQQYCEDKNCKKIDEEEGSPMGSMIRFVNKIAANFPDKTISTLAYQYTRKPPKTKPAKNVLITLCSIECDRSSPIEEKCTDFANDLKGWTKLTKNIRVWDYTTQFTNFLAPFPNIHTLQPNLKFFSNNNTKWVFEQHSNNPSELFELRSYIMAKLLWNPDENVDKLISEFTDNYYEEAGVFIKKYIDLIHEKIKLESDFFLFLYGDPSQAFSSYLNPKLLNTYNSYFDDSEKAVSTKKEIIKRVKEARLGVDYAILEACRKNISDDFVLTKDNAKGDKIKNPFVINKLNNFKTTCKNADITFMNEMGYTVKEYYTNYKKTLERAILPNKAFNKKVTLNTNPKKYAKEDPQVLTDGALGGNSFFANWLGFEGNNMEAVIDLENKENISHISTAFLQVTNHVVFFPVRVHYYYSNDAKNFVKIGILKNDKPLTRKSKVNYIKYFDLKFSKTKARYIKVKAENINTPPYWHHAAGQPSWIFADEIIIN